MDTIEEKVAGCRAAFNTGRTKDIKYRRQQLKNLLRLYEENASQLFEVLKKDMNKPETEATLSEVGFMIRDAKLTLKNLDSLTKPKYIPKHLFTFFDKVHIRKEPYGVVLIIGPWNYLHLTLMPLVGAIAAGNCAVIKPSEVSSSCADKVAELIPKYLDPECYKVVLGGPQEIAQLLEEKFDYIFYTGSFNIGKIIHAGANKNLTPCTLELGGKCPVYVDETANLYMTAQRIMWGKFSNCGQTCVAPDYIMCTKEVQSKLIEEFKKVLNEFYGTDWQKSQDSARIINNRHFHRLKSLISNSKGKVIIGGRTDENDLYIEPTVLVDVRSDDVTMEGEIFGPVLPMLIVQTPKEVIDFINERHKPLCIYVFTSKQAVVDLFVSNTDSGAVDINDCIYHCSIFKIPFGGVGESGMGQYHGKWSYKTFCRPRGILHRSFDWFSNKHSMETRYPPYTASKLAVMTNGLRIFEFFYIDFFRFVPHAVCFILGIFFLALLMYFEILPCSCFEQPGKLTESLP